MRCRLVRPMNEYAYRGIDERGKAVRIRFSAKDPEAVLVHARESGHHVIMVYRLISAKSRYEPLLASANFPLPKQLSKSVFRRFDPKAGPSMICYSGRDWGAIRTAIHDGILQGDVKWFRTTVQTESLLQAVVQATMDRLVGMLSGVDPCPEPELTMADIEFLPRRLYKWTPTDEPWEGRDDKLPPLPTINPNTSRVAQFLSVSCFPFADPRTVFTKACFSFAELCLYAAFTLKAQGLRWYRDSVSSHEEVLFAHSPPERRSPSPREMHGDVLLILAALVGIRPDTLPPASSRRDVFLQSGHYSVEGKTRLTDDGEEIELRWSERTACANNSRSTKPPQPTTATS